MLALLAIGLKKPLAPKYHVVVFLSMYYNEKNNIWLFLLAYGGTHETLEVKLFKACNY